MRLDRRLSSLLLCASLLASTTTMIGCSDDPKPNNGPSKNQNNTNNTNDMADDMAGDMTSDMTTANTNSISAADQSLDDPLKVTVAQVSADVAGFVVIHEDNNGAPGAVIGVEPVEAGPSSDVSISLDRVAVDGETLYAMLHKDDPADGKYTFDGQNGEDGPALDKDNMVVVKGFKVTVTNTTITPSVEVVDQELTNVREVTIKRIVSDGAGFIVIHEDNNGAPGAVLGHALLSSGPNREVKVSLSRDAINGETFYAMLHKDDPADGQYTFDGQNGEDGPVSDANGNIITPPFKVSVQAPTFDPVLETEAQTTMDPLLVTIKRVVSDGPGWVVIREDNNNAPGAIIGTAFAGNGESLNVLAQLNREAIDGETLHVVLHKDDPADGRYSFDGQSGEDGPALKDGQQITSSFVISVNVPIINSLTSPSVFDISSPRDLFIPSVTSDGPGWIIIHEADANGTPGAVIGQTLVQSGTTQGVMVTTTRDLVDGESIVVMLHKDDPADGQYTHGSDAQTDVPALDGQGQVVQQLALIVSPQNQLQISSQDLIEFTTQVTISRVSLDTDGWIVVREHSIDPNTGNVVLSAPIGYKPIISGEYVDEVITLDRPLGIGSTLAVEIRVDSPTDGILDISNNNDPLALNGAGDALTDIMGIFSVDPLAVAVRFTVSNQGASAYRVTNVEPAAFISAVSAINSDNPTFNLKRGWRYGFENTASAGHPLEFTNAGATRAQDTVLLSQAVQGSLQGDLTIDWQTNMGTAVFTVAPSFTGADALTGYRCSVTGHASMRGGINVTDP